MIKITVYRIRQFSQKEVIAGHPAFAMMKKTVAVLLGILTAVVFTVSPAFAADISGIETQGNKITATITPDKGSKAEKDKISATLDGKPLAVESVETADGSTEYIVMIDTSLSLSNAHFEAQKGAVKSLYNSKGKDDTFILYTFDKTSKKILDGSESSEDAVKKISAIKASGQDTAFYEAIVTLTGEAGNSKADATVPVVFTDGIETLDKGAKSKAEKALKDTGIPVYGLYPSVEKESDSAALGSLLKLSGGSASSFTPDNIAKKLADVTDKAKAATGDVTAIFTASEPIEANDKAVLSIDLGDGKPVTKETAVKAWQPEETSETESTKETETQTEAPVTGQTTAQGGETEQGLDLMKIIIPAAAALVLILAVLLIFRKLKSGKKDKPEDNPPEPEVTEEPEITEEPEAAPEEEPQAEEEPEAPAEEEPETPEEPAEEEPVSEADTETEETPAEGEEAGAEGEEGAEGAEGEEQAEEEPESEEEAAAKAEAKRRAEERARRRAANLERAKAKAAERAAMLSNMSNENKEAAEAAAAKENEKRRRREKEEAQAAKERAKKEKANKKKMKEEGGNFQFYFVDKK